MMREGNEYRKAGQGALDKWHLRRWESESGSMRMRWQGGHSGH